MVAGGQGSGDDLGGGGAGRYGRAVPVGVAEARVFERLAGPGNACRACSTCGDVAPQWLGGLLPTGKKPHRSMECRWMHEKERKRGGGATERGKRWWRVPRVAGVPVARKPVAQKWPYSRGTAKNGVEPAGRRRRPPPSRRWVSDAAVPRITTIGPNSEKREKREKRENTR